MEAIPLKVYCTLYQGPRISVLTYIYMCRDRSQDCVTQLHLLSCPVLLLHADRIREGNLKKCLITFSLMLMYTYDTVSLSLPGPVDPCLVRSGQKVKVVPVIFLSMREGLVSGPVYFFNILALIYLAAPSSFLYIGSHDMGDRTQAPHHSAIRKGNGVNIYLGRIIVLRIRDSQKRSVNLRTY